MLNTNGWVQANVSHALMTCHQCRTQHEGRSEGLSAEADDAAADHS